MPTNAKKQKTTTTPRAKKAENTASEKLIQLEESKPERTLPKDLNQRIGQIDTELDELRSELKNTNKGVKTSLTQLSDKDTDLTSRVSEAYQQLGNLDNAYQSLTDKSSRISTEIKAISKQIIGISEKTDAEIGTLSEGFQTLLQQLEELSHKSKLTTQQLNKSIKDNAQSMQALEQTLLSEIDGLAQRTQARDDDLSAATKAVGEGLSKAEEEIRASQARMIKLQSVDQALEKRADLLEATTAELSKTSKELSRATTQLNQRTSQLSTAIESLQKTSVEHSGLIARLQGQAEKTANALYSLIMLEKRHFRLVTGGLILLLLAISALFFYEYGNWRQEAVVNNQLQAEVGGLSEDLAATDNDVARVDQRIAEVDTNVQTEITQIQDKLTNLGDQVESLDGRLTNQRPYKTFGNGNVIHGPEWLAAQPAQLYAIHIATLNDKQSLYKLAERYSQYLNDDLAYLPVQVNQSERFALVYGQYASEQEATTALSRLPRYIERQQPVVQPMSNIQRYIPDQSK